MCYAEDYVNILINNEDFILLCVYTMEFRTNQILLMTITTFAWIYFLIMRYGL